MSGHVVGVGSVSEVHLVSAGCTCGWVLVQGFATGAGLIAAQRWVALKADRHLDREHDHSDDPYSPR